MATKATIWFTPTQPGAGFLSTSRETARLLKKGCSLRGTSFVSANVCDLGARIFRLLGLRLDLQPGKVYKCTLNLESKVTPCR
jgi:hypothetical protein